ncbi:MAG: hypothetical protein Q9M25_04055 [Mariprofundaceae bacterium]|nr:hypothetical protein [Mariprofundaceae bacterium]
MNTVMPENFAGDSLSSAFIWYHADARLAGQLADWVRKISSELDVDGRLLIRHQKDKTTFMENYAGAGKETVAHIEQMAVKQDWFAQLLSARQAEIFAQVNLRK